MKMIFNILAGIAILFGSVIGSVATATTTTTATDVDEVCYRFVVVGVGFTTTRTRYVKLVIGDVGGVAFNARIQVYNQAGTQIATNRDFTIPANGSTIVGNGFMGRGVSDVETYGPSRTIHITTDADALIAASHYRYSPDSARNMNVMLPVYKRQLTNTKTWEAPCDPPDDKKS